MPKKEAKQTKERSSRFFSQHTFTDAFSKNKDWWGSTKNDTNYHFGIAGWTNNDGSSYKALEKAKA